MCPGPAPGVLPPCALIARSPTGCRGLLSGSLRPHPRCEGLGDAGKRLLHCLRQQEVRSLAAVPACGCERGLGCVCMDVSVHACPCFTCVPVRVSGHMAGVLRTHVCVITGVYTLCMRLLSTAASPQGVWCC